MSRNPSRRTTPPPSLLEAVASAGAAYTGEATPAGERAVDAATSGLRGGGFRLTITVTPQQAIFGPLPQGPQRVEGDTALPPDRRSPPDGPRFPPDDVRELPYWDTAQPPGPHPVLVVALDPPLVRRLSGPADDLPAVVARVRGWVEADAGKHPGKLLGELSTPGNHPAAYLAAFELLQRSAPDIVALVEAFLDLPDRPGAATRAVLGRVYQATGRLPETARSTLGARLAAVLPREHDPAALLGYLTWFDAYAGSLDGPTKAAVAREAERIAGMHLTGPDATAWRSRLDQQLASLRAKLGTP